MSDEYTQARSAIATADPDVCRRIANDARGILAVADGVIHLSRTDAVAAHSVASAVRRWAECDSATLPRLIDDGDAWGLVLLRLLVMAREGDDRPDWAHYATAARRLRALVPGPDATRRKFSTWADTYERARFLFQPPSDPPPGISRAEAVALWDACRVLVSASLTDEHADDDGRLVAFLRSFGLVVRTHSESKTRLLRDRLLF